MERRTGQAATGHQRLSQRDMEIVRAIHMFDELDPKVVDRLVEHATVESADSDRLLFSAGDPADRFYIVLTGRVRLFALTAQGKQTTISFIEAGFSFAEGAIFGMRFLPVNAEVCAGTRLAQIPRDPFVSQLMSEPDLTFKMLAALARWQSRLIDAVTELKTRSPSQRFAAVLLSLTDRVSGPADVPLPISKSALANRIGIAPESLSRVFVRMQGLGVTVEGSTIRISDVTMLREHCLQAGDAA
ncbi:MAG: Crp/Fnr family transcriptional regulator [Alphaproteobacteria bacterium]|nr:Crp/Fnr family transcriptional regulator [Alphaproteobacteria bacterium]